MEKNLKTVKQYRVLNTSNQTVFIHFTTKTQGLTSNSSIDVPETDISQHVKILARRGHIRLFECQE
jgi:hypothetical protein